MKMTNTQSSSSLGNSEESHNRLVVNGSRGIGGILTNGNMLGLYDLEEDEEADDDSDEEMDSDEDDDEEEE